MGVLQETPNDVPYTLHTLPISTKINFGLGKFLLIIQIMMGISLGLYNQYDVDGSIDVGPGYWELIVLILVASIWHFIPMILLTISTMKRNINRGLPLAAMIMSGIVWFFDFWIIGVGFLLGYADAGWTFNGKAEEIFSIWLLICFILNAILDFGFFLLALSEFKRYKRLRSESSQPLLTSS